MFVDAQPSGDRADVFDPQRRIANGRHDRSDRAHCVDPLLGTVEVIGLHSGAHREVEHGHGVVDQGLHGMLTLAVPQIIRVLTCRGHRHVGLGGPALILAVSPHSRLLPGRITIESEDHPRGRQPGLIAQDPSQRLDVVDAERGATGRDRSVHPSHMAGHHVGVSLNDHGTARRSHRLLGDVQPVEHRGLFVERRLGGVQVFGRDLVVVIQPPRAKAHGVTGDVADGPDHASAKPIVEPALAPAGKTSCDQLVLGEPFVPKVSRQGSTR